MAIGRRRVTYIHFGSVRATASGPDFGGNINSSADAPGHVAGICAGSGLVGDQLTAGRQSEVSNFYIFDSIRTSTDEDVLRLEIPVNDVEAVDVSEALEDLTEETPDLLCLFRQIPRYQVAEGLGDVSSDEKEERTGELQLTRFSQYSMEMYMMVRNGRVLPLLTRLLGMTSWFLGALLFRVDVSSSDEVSTSSSSSSESSSMADS
jgi:hypothetical protein